MWSWLAGLIEAVLAALLAPKNASATQMAGRAGAAELAAGVDDRILGKVGEAVAARDAAGAVQPVIPGLLPDDGWRRD